MDDTLEDLLNDLTTAKAEADDLAQKWINTDRSNLTHDELLADQDKLVAANTTVAQLKKQAYDFLETDPEAKRIVQIVQLMKLVELK